MTSTLRLATLDDTGNVPVGQLGNAPSGSGGLPVFQASHAYTAGTQISQAGQLYAAKVDFTSGASFSAGDWNLLGAGGSVTKAAVIGTGVLATDLGGDAAGAASAAQSAAITAAKGVPLGLTGVTAATRFVGATTSGAPATGTFLKGDWCIDQTGTIWVCGTAGSPGTWAQPPGTGGGGGLSSLTSPDSTITIGGTLSAPTLAAGSILARGTLIQPIAGTPTTANAAPSGSGPYTLAVNIPTITIGNDAYLFVAGASAVSTPSGWTLKTSDTTTDAKTYLFKRTIDGTEGATVTLSWTTNPNQVAAVITPVSGQTTGEVYGSFGTQPSASGSVASSVTTPAAQSLVLYFQASADAATESATPPSGFAEIADVTAAFGYRQVSVGYKTASVASGTAVNATVNVASTAALAMVMVAIPSNNYTYPAPLDSPSFTGTPTAPTPPTADSSTRVATTAQVQAAAAAAVSGGGGSGSAAAVPTWIRTGDPDVGGRVGKIHVSKYDSNRIFVPGDMLGLGLSEDGGQTWMPTFGLPTYEMGSVTEHPTNPLEKWAGTTGGPIKSTDGGKNWVVKRNGMGAASAYPATAPIEKILFDQTDTTSKTMLAFMGSWRQWVEPGNPGAANYGKVYKSTDGGETWTLLATLVTGGNIQWVTASPTWTALFAAIQGNGIWKSTDKGTTWTQLTSASSLAGTPNGYTTGLATADGTTVFASFDHSAVSGGNYGPGGVYKSTDGGVTWALAGTGQPQHTDSTANNATSIWSITLTPDNILYFTDKSWINEEKLYKSTDMGATWTNTTFAISGRFFLGPSGPWYITPDPNTNGVLWGGQDGIIKSTDAGATWKDMGNNANASGAATTGKGYSGILGTAVMFSKFQENLLFTNGFDSGNLLRSGDGGQSWTAPTWAGWDYYDGGYGTAIGGPTGLVVYSLLGQANIFNGVAVSLDGGKTITRVATGGGLPARFSFWTAGRNGLAIGSADGSVCYALMGNYLYKTTNFGVSWAIVSTTPSGMQMSDIAISADFSTMYITGPGWGVKRSTDGGATWPGFGTGAPSGGMWRLVIGPDGSTLYGAGYSARQSALTAGAYKWDGTAWTHLYGGTYAQFCSDIAVDPWDANHIIVVTDQNPFGDYCQAGGVLESKDGGTTWTQQNANLPFKRVMSCAFDPFHPGRVIVGTDGSGFWTTKTYGTATPKSLNASASSPVDDIDVETRLRAIRQQLVTAGASANSIDGVTVSGTPAAGQSIVATGPAAATWQSPTVIDGVTVSGTPSSGQAIVATGPAAATWQTPGVGPTGPAGPSGTAMLASTSYNPGTTSTYSATSTSSVDLDAARLAVTFSAPASGNVVVTFSAVHNAGASTQLNWQVRSAGSVLADEYMASSTALNFRLTARFLITGLTAGTSYTFTWGSSRPVGTNSAITYAGGNTGQAVITVEAA